MVESPPEGPPSVPWEAPLRTGPWGFPPPSSVASFHLPSNSPLGACPLYCQAPSTSLPPPLPRCTLVKDLAPLAACASLRHLDLSLCLRVMSLSALSACTEMRTLNLGGCQAPLDLTALRALPALHVIPYDACR